VSVLGLGTVGLPTAIYISKFFKVKGYDIEVNMVRRALASGIDATTSWAEVSDADIFVITVSTGMTVNGKADISAVQDILSKISRDNPSSLVCVESTVPVGTCRKLSEKLNLKYVVHCPHRYWSQDPVKYGVAQLRVLGAINEESLNMGKWFYDSLKIPVHVVSSIEVAEMSKIAENAYRFVQIAFAEELCLICKKLGLSFEEVRKACNTKWNVEILEARDGIGGHCLPKDTRYLWEIMKTPLLTGAIKADEEYKKALKKKGRAYDPRINTSVQRGKEYW
jgi:UDP-N-acetyl-D-mannosaminuronic acid dehydrogenase